MQVIPHITDEIKARVREASRADVAIVEVGGTVGDIESLPFLEAMRQLARGGPQNAVTMHVTLVPYIAAAGEMKTKPTQHSVRSARDRHPARYPRLPQRPRDRPRDQEEDRPVLQRAGRARDRRRDVAFIYELPLLLPDEGIDQEIAER